MSPLRTTRDSFETMGVLRGAEVLERMSTTNELGGFIQALRQWPERPQLVGLVRLPAWPGGPLTAETFDWVMFELLGVLDEAWPVNALLLALHGSMAAEHHPDTEGELLAAVRHRVGAAVPVVVTLDLHANLTDRMVRAVDALALYHTAPHVDVFETGARAAGVLRRILVDGAKPVTVYQKLPMVLPPENANTEAESGVSVDLKRELQALERRPVVLSAGIATVQPWLDIPDLGSAVVVISDADVELATAECRRIAEILWSRRQEYLPELVSIESAVKLAHEAHAVPGLVVLSDAADSTTSGAPGDSVYLLEELLHYRWRAPVLVTVVAPDVVARCEAAGEGRALITSLGGVRDTRFGTRLTLEATVERVFDARFVLSGHLGKDMPIDMGRGAVLAREQLRIVLTSHSGPHFAPQLFEAAGLDPFAAAVLVAKSPCGFRAAYERHARRIYQVRAPGCAPPEFWRHRFERIPRPTWPWDEIDAWRAQPVVVMQRRR